MLTSTEITRLRDRADKFFKINEKATLNELKFYLDCKATELMMALGCLVAQDRITIHNEGWETVINRHKETD